jgi:hypothetical protein
MNNETNKSNTLTSNLAQKLSSLQPKKRATNQAKIAKHYDDITDAIERGVSLTDIRDVLAEDGLKLSSATFKKLLEAERKRRGESNDAAGMMNKGEA